MASVSPQAIGGAQDVRNVAQYVLSLSGSAHNQFAAQAGKAKFAACAACHGVNGKGNPALGAPDLTDKVWLHGWGEPAIIDDPARQGQPDAGARRQVVLRADPGAGGLRVEPVANDPHRRQDAVAGAPERA